MSTEFKQHILFILKLGKLKDSYIHKMWENGGLDMYTQAYTHPSVDPENNYESLEILGDSVINQCIVWYLYRRFPKLNHPLGVKVIARLKINLVSKQQFFEIARDLGMWDFIRADAETRQTKMKPTLEDVLEAFFGATGLLLDQVKTGLGNVVSYKIIKTLLDRIDISLRYEDLYDPITRLKETIDFYKGELGQIVYEDVKDMEKLITKSTVYQVKYYPNRKCFNCGNGMREIKSKTRIGVGTAALKKDARQRSSLNALQALERMGFKKPVPAYYQTLL